MGYVEELIETLEEHKRRGEVCAITIPFVLDETYNISDWEIVSVPQGEYIGKGVWRDIRHKNIFDLLVSKGNIHIEKMDGKFLKLDVIEVTKNETGCEQSSRS